VSDWVGQYKRFWNTKLDALENYLNVLQSKPAKVSVKKKKTIVKNKNQKHARKKRA